MVVPAVRVLAKDGVGSCVRLFGRLLLLAPDSSFPDGIVLGASFEFTVNPMKSSVGGLDWKEGFPYGRQDWEWGSALIRCPRIAFMDARPILLWYAFTRSGACTFDADSQVLSLSG